MAKSSPGDRRQALEEQILSALVVPIQPVPSGPLYRASLIVTAIAMLILPILYFGLMYLIGHTIWWYWVRSVKLGVGPVMPILVTGFGLIVLLFLVKPFIAGNRRDAAPLRLKEAAEPFIFEYVSRLCELVGAPAPKSIRVNCNVNASASFRVGLLSLFRNDLTLTIGLPLVAGMSLRQLTGVLAHEFGHFAQGAGMRAYFVIATINSWFFQAAYERDQWDDYLYETADRLPARLGIFFHIARFFVWLTRLMMAGVAWVGHGISCYMSRQMEYDADLHEIRLSGSKSFASTCQQLTDLNLAQMMTLDDMAQFYSEGRLPDDFPAMIVSSVSHIPKELRKKIRSYEREEETGWFDTHPTNLDRKARARAEATPGVYALQQDLPASVLFQDFKRLCKAFTIEYYKEILDKDFKKSLLKPVGTLIARRDGEVEAGKALDRYFQTHIPIFRPLILADDVTQPPVDPRESTARLRATREKMLALVDEYEVTVKRYNTADKKLLLASEAQVIVSCGIKITPEEFQLESAKSHVVSTTVKRARQGVETLAAKMMEFEELATERITEALRLLQLKPIYSKIPDGEALCHEMRRLAPDARFISDMINELLPIRFVYRRLNALLSRLSDNQQHPDLYESIEDQMEKLHFRLVAMEEEMSSQLYPLDHADDSKSLSDFVLPEIPDPRDLVGLLGATQFSAERLMGLQIRLVAKLAHAAEKVEEAFGMPPLQERKKPTEKQQRDAKN